MIFLEAALKFFGRSHRLGTPCSLYPDIAGSLSQAPTPQSVVPQRTSRSNDSPSRAINCPGKKGYEAKRRLYVPLKAQKSKVDPSKGLTANLERNQAKDPLSGRISQVYSSNNPKKFGFITAISKQASKQKMNHLALIASDIAQVARRSLAFAGLVVRSSSPRMPPMRRTFRLYYEQSHIMIISSVEVITDLLNSKLTDP